MTENEDNGGAMLTDAIFYDRYRKGVGGNDEKVTIT